MGALLNKVSDTEKSSAVFRLFLFSNLSIVIDQGFAIPM